MAFTFSDSAVARIRAAVRRVERTPTDLRGERSNTYQPGQDFFALLLGQDLSGRWSFQGVTPDPAGVHPDSFRPIDGDGINWAFQGEAFYDAAREANGNRVGPAALKVVRMTFAGYDAAQLPVFVFVHSTTETSGGLPPHDHRDNLNGGFAFATFHPGTSTPQLPYAL